MSASSSVSPRPPHRVATDDDLQALGDVLLRRGWDSSILRCRTCGELDVRLEVRHRDGPAVELLGSWADGACGASWQAVRLTSAGRVVWCGPPRSCDRAQLIEFVENLLSREDEQLACRYVRLG